MSKMFLAQLADLENSDPFVRAVNEGRARIVSTGRWTVGTDVEPSAEEMRNHTQPYTTEWIDDPTLPGIGPRAY